MDRSAPKIVVDTKQSQEFTIEINAYGQCRISRELLSSNMKIRIYKPISNMLYAKYGPKWVLMPFVNNSFRKMCGSVIYEPTGEWRKKDI